MKTNLTSRSGLATCLALTLLAGSPALLLAGGQPNGVPQKTAVSGQFNWILVPPNLPPYLIQGTDQNLYLNNMPLVGTFSLTGKGISLDPATTKISVQLSGDFDPITFSGPLWSPVVLTAKVAGVNTVIFKGSATADTVALVSVGKVTLEGYGPFEGTKLEFDFEEIGPGNSDVYNFQGTLMPAPKK